MPIVARWFLEYLKELVLKVFEVQQQKFIIVQYTEMGLERIYIFGEFSHELVNVSIIEESQEDYELISKKLDCVRLWRALP